MIKPSPLFRPQADARGVADAGMVSRTLRGLGVADTHFRSGRCSRSVRFLSTALAHPMVGSGGPGGGPQRQSD